MQILVKVLETAFVVVLESGVVVVVVVVVVVEIVFEIVVARYLTNYLVASK